jgi:hypothetical protein
VPHHGRAVAEAAAAAAEEAAAAAAAAAKAVGRAGCQQRSRGAAHAATHAVLVAAGVDATAKNAGTAVEALYWSDSNRDEARAALFDFHGVSGEASDGGVDGSRAEHELVVVVHVVQKCLFVCFNNNFQGWVDVGWWLVGCDPEKVCHQPNIRHHSLLLAYARCVCVGGGVIIYRNVGLVFGIKQNVCLIQHLISDS